MNIYTRQIAEFLSISLEDAEQVQFEMECNDFDFSEASDLAFKRAAKLAYTMISN